jgi:hypothetical protein
MPPALASEYFVLRVVSSVSRDPEHSHYLVFTRLNNGEWIASPTRLNGIFEVRRFLSDNFVEEKQIALAIDELSRKRGTMVSRPQV